MPELRRRELAASSGSRITVVPLEATENGTYYAEQGTAFNPVTVNVPCGGGSENDDVQFIDLDGSVICSYSAADFLQLQALPENPVVHTGLTFSHWNWTLADAKAQVQALTLCDIGAIYEPTDGKTHIFIQLFTDLDRHIILDLTTSLASGSTGVTVDWGDGSPTETYSANLAHTYSAIDSYEIKLGILDGDRVTFKGNYSDSSGEGSTFLKIASQGTGRQSTYAAHELIKKVYLSNNCYIGQYGLGKTAVEEITGTTIGDSSFHDTRQLKCVIYSNPTTTSLTLGAYGAQTLKRVSFPKTITSFASSFLRDCSLIRRVVFPYTTTRIQSSCFSGCIGLTTLAYPSTFTMEMSGTFTSCYSLTKLTIPSGVTNMGGSLNNCRALRELNLPNTITSLGSSGSGMGALWSLEKLDLSQTAITTLNSYAVNEVYSLRVFKLPEGVATLPTYMARYAYSLNEFTIPSSVTQIKTQAFADWSAISYMTFLPTTPPTLANSSVLPASAKTIYFIPYSSATNYMTATNYPAQTASVFYSGFATYQSGDTLPTSITGYTLTWYATKDDVYNSTNPITEGNGEEVYCTFTATT